MSQTQTSSPAYRIVNPATGEVEQTFEAATDAEIESALGSAHSAYDAWKDVPIEERAKVVKREAELFGERQKELGAICGDIFDYFANEGPTLAADQPIKTFSGGTAVVQKLPIDTGTLSGGQP